ncbi:ATP-dependent DNA ligase [Herbaspirillum rubrisubalbicans]|uniref:DNA ligase (ATP) n=2 Tax=Herbaspirillum rubrisubalbicans TaxID=80842 RepID=A0ABX9C8E8_9BURK|nr:ATP-dependent DNA ligase [Herbaspirillum rubrisubalbicans]RAN49212.1 ATP-dependent DNA ligase [Herbaspirillum rubrisubalbicans]
MTAPHLRRHHRSAALMREFSRLYAELDATTSTTRKLAALQDYFGRADGADAAWAVYFLAGGKPRQAVPTSLLKQCAMAYAGIDGWLFEECYQSVGDLAETIAHILPPPRHSSDLGLARWMIERIAPLRGADPDTIRSALFAAWDELDWQGRFLLSKLIGGGFRVGVSRLLVTRALAAVAQLDPKLLAQRMVGWTDGRARPDAERFAQLIAPADGQDHRLQGGQPYPFFLAHPLMDPPQTLGALSHWQVEWKYDGIRAQLVRRHGRNWLWSRGEELITERFPELAALDLPDGTVIDGEIVIRLPETSQPDDRVAPFADLQKRIGRKHLSARLLAELPAGLIAYDLLEQHGHDLRGLPQHQRRTRLEALVHAHAAPALMLAPQITASDWAALEQLRATSRQRGVEGMMLKQVQAHYGIGRTRNVGTWWKWKVDPYSIDAVLIYAQAGHGRRASLYTDYTFAVWDGPETPHGQRKLVPFAKAYSGLTDAEIAVVDQAIRKTTIEKFGPVRSVKPSMVFEIGFEGIALSSRHKAGIAVRFPRILRQRLDKTVEQADTLESLRALLAPLSSSAPQDD